MSPGGWRLSKHPARLLEIVTGLTNLYESPTRQTLGGA